VPPYSVYGLTLASELPIDGLPPAPGGERIDVELHYGSLPETKREPGASIPLAVEPATDAEPSLTIRRVTASGELWLRYADGAEFLIDPSGRSVLVTWSPELSFEDAIVYLLGPVLGILLRLRRRTCLHASVVAVGDWAVAFLGPAGAGKSTTAATFAQRGHEVLSDDLLVLREQEGGFWAEPGHSWLRLWPASVAGLFGSPEALPLIVEGWEKRYLDLAVEEAFCPAPRRLGAIYVLGDRARDSADPTIGRLSGHAATMALVGNSYVGYLLSAVGASQRREEFERLDRLISTVPVREVVVPGDWEALGELPAVVTEDFTSNALVGSP
jgi:hypothetical protein